MIPTNYHVAVSVDVDRFSDGKIEHDYLPMFCGAKSAAEVREHCQRARERGLEVFPPCDNVDERGSCRGHIECEARFVEIVVRRDHVTPGFLARVDEDRWACIGTGITPRAALIDLASGARSKRFSWVGADRGIEVLLLMVDDPKRYRAGSMSGRGKTLGDAIDAARERLDQLVLERG